jgi:ABC transport system ATP-binding/permease protein
MTPTVRLQLGSAEARLEGEGDRIHLGRDPDCGLSTPDPSLSRRHAEIFLQGGEVFVRDLGSANGTWIDGQQLGLEPVRLVPGQAVFFGQVPLVILWHVDSR